MSYSKNVYFAKKNSDKTKNDTTVLTKSHLTKSHLTKSHRTKSKVNKLHLNPLESDAWHISSLPDTSPIDIKNVDDARDKAIIPYTTNVADNVIYITKSGAFIKFEYFQDSKFIRKVENYFTLQADLLMGKIRKLKCCTVDKKASRIIVPRFGVFEIINKKFGITLDSVMVKSQIKKGEPPKTPFVWNGRQTENQKVIAEHIMQNNFSDARVSCGSAGAILNLEAGQGKSFLAAYLISILQLKTVIILHSTALIEQWVKVLTTVFGKDVSIGYYYATKKRDGDIVIQIIDSSANSQFLLDGKYVSPIEYYNRFGFAIYDECHIYSHKTAQRALKSAQTTYMLGLSATPDENPDGFDSAVWWTIGPVLNAKELPGYSSASENFEAVVHRVMYSGPPKYTQTLINPVTDLINVGQTVNMLCEDYYRTMLVIECIEKSLELGLYTFVFADRRAYLLHLRDTLHLTKKIKGVICNDDADFVRIVGGAEASELETAEAKSKVIFTTYQYMGTGKSIIKMNGLVLATPRRSKMRQYINRIFRLGSDASVQRHIWDICDMRIKLASQWHTRLKYYNEKQYDVLPEKHKYTDFEDVVMEYNLNVKLLKLDDADDEDDADDVEDDLEDDVKDDTKVTKVKKTVKDKTTIPKEKTVKDTTKVARSPKSNSNITKEKTVKDTTKVTKVTKTVKEKTTIPKEKTVKEKKVKKNTTKVARSPNSNITKVKATKVNQESNEVEVNQESNEVEVNQVNHKKISNSISAMMKLLKS